jgi:hypothetical protein
MSKTTRCSNRVIAEDEARAADSARQRLNYDAQWARQDKLLDWALEQTFPASDPPSATQPTR